MNQKGQILVFSIFVSLIALTSVLILSSRYVKGLRNIVKTDNFGRAQYVAESLAERLLDKSDEVLSDYVKNHSCSSDCYLEFEDGSQAYADINIIGDSIDTYKLNIKNGETIEINLEGYPSNTLIDFCWNEKSSIEVVYLYSQNTDYLINTYAYNAIATPYNSNFETATPNHGYSNCFTLETTNNPLLVRIKSLYENTDLAVISEAGIKLPLQGFTFHIKGRFLDVSKDLIINKKNQISTDILDYVMYQKSADSSLSK